MGVPLLTEFEVMLLAAINTADHKSNRSRTIQTLKVYFLGFRPLSEVYRSIGVGG